MRLPYWRVTSSKLTIEAWGCVTCLLLMVRSASATRVLGSGELGIGRQGGSGATGGGHRGDRAVDTHPQDPVLGWDRRDGEAADQGEGATDTRRTSAGRRERADPGMSGEVAWGRWRLAWHGFFYLLVAYATATAIADASPSAAGVAARLALVGALGGWYAWWMIARPAARAEVIYLVGAVALLAPLCLHDLRHGAAVVLVVAAGLLWQLAHQQGGVPWPAVVAVSVFAAGTVLSVGYVGAIVRQSRERQRLLEQLRATRAELAAAERRAGMLEERQRLARDIHDTLSQGFASVVLLLEAAEESLATGQPVDRHIT